MKLKWFIGVLTVVIVVASVAWPAPADDPKPAKPASSLDDELLKSLGDETPKKPKEAPAARPAGPAATKPNPLDDELLKELGGPEPKAKTPEAESDSKDPLVRLSKEMRDAERMLAELEGNEKTQQLQQKIVDQLEALIKQLQQQQQQQSSSSSSQKPKPGSQRQQVQQPQSKSGSTSPGQSNQPARDSSKELTNRKPEKPDASRVTEMLKDVWGDLPPRVRQQMMQMSSERFLPKYELLIEQYFKALADRKKDGSSRP